MKLNQITTVILTAAVAGTSSWASAAGTSTGGEWEFQFAPLFLWGISLDGDATIGDKTAPLDIAFNDDVLDNLEAVYTFHFEARKDRLTLFAEYQYVNLTPNVVMGPVETDIDFKNTMFEAGVGYAFGNSDRTRWEVLLGVRYSDQEIDVDGTINLPPPPAGPGPLPVGISGGDDWVHPFVGGKVKHSLSDRWSFIARADYGYADSDNTAANAVAMFDYRFRDWGSVFLGYRAMNYDYSNDKEGSDGYAYDAVQQGPLLGINLFW